MKSHDSPTLSVFNYLDYRDFLRDLVKELKGKKLYDVRSFARRAGIRTPGYMKMVMDGKRNLSPESTDKFCHALRLSGSEKKYFEALVLYSQSADPDFKKECLDELLALRPRVAPAGLGPDECRYFSRPYYVIIYEMVDLPGFKEDYKWIAKRCFPAIRASEAKEAIEALLKIGLLRRDVTGRLARVKKVIHTGDKNNGIAQTYHYHEAVLNLARHALGSLSQEERHYNSLTLPLSKRKFLAIIEKFYALQEEILRESEPADADSDEVYQINFQLYPVTKKKESAHERD